MAPHSCILAWKIPLAEEPDGLLLLYSCKVTIAAKCQTQLSYGAHTHTHTHTSQERVFTLIQFSSVTQSCPAVCNPMDCSSPGFPVCPSPAPRVCSNSCPLSQ